MISGSSSFGRASAFQAEGGRFEPGLPLKIQEIKNPSRWVWNTNNICIFTAQFNWKTSAVNQFNANVAQSVEHIHGKDEVTSSILVIGSRNEK